MDTLKYIEVFIGGAPLLELRLTEGLIKFGRSHPHWRFSLRGANFRYSPKWLRQHNISGALVLIDAAPVKNSLDSAGIPWVHLLPAAVASHCTVSIDDYMIGRMGAEKFLELGFTQFFFCGVKTSWSSIRAEGFKSRLAEAGYECENMDVAFTPVNSWTLHPRGEQQLNKWVIQLKTHTAVMAGHDVVANRLVDVCIRNRIRVPEEVAILGVGNHELFCELSPVTISSIDAAIPEVAIRGAGLLEAMINNQPVELPPPLVKPRGIVERRSTEIFAFDDMLICRVVGYIYDHVCDGLTVNNLSTYFNMSSRTLARRFASSLGHSPGTEIRKARLRHAKRMLRDSNLTLTEVAMACGFADLSHMDRSFQSSFNCTPGLFRKNT